MYAILSSSLPSSNNRTERNIPTHTGIYIVIIWAIVCISLISTRSHDISASLLYKAPFRNASGWDNKAYVYLVGWILCTIATGSVSAYITYEKCRDIHNGVSACIGCMRSVRTGICEEWFLSC